MLSELPTALLTATDTIDEFIALRIALVELEQRIKALQPAFYAACAATGQDKLPLEKALITRKLTRGVWAYPPTILEQEDAIKKLRSIFQKTHEPVAGREVIWAVKLLIEGLDGGGDSE